MAEAAAALPQEVDDVPPQLVSESSASSNSDSESDGTRPRRFSGPAGLQPGFFGQPRGATAGVAATAAPAAGPPGLLDDIDRSSGAETEGFDEELEGWDEFAGAGAGLFPGGAGLAGVLRQHMDAVDDEALLRQVPVQDLLEAVLQGADGPLAGLLGAGAGAGAGLAGRGGWPFAGAALAMGPGGGRAYMPSGPGLQVDASQIPAGLEGSARHHAVSMAEQGFVTALDPARHAACAAEGIPGGRRQVTSPLARPAAPRAPRAAPALPRADSAAGGGLQRGDSAASQGMSRVARGQQLQAGASAGAGSRLARLASTARTGGDTAGGDDDPPPLESDHSSAPGLASSSGSEGSEGSGSTGRSRRRQRMAPSPSRRQRRNAVFGQLPGLATGAEARAGGGGPGLSASDPSSDSGSDGEGLAAAAAARRATRRARRTARHVARGSPPPLLVASDSGSGGSDSAAGSLPRLLAGSSHSRGSGSESDRMADFPGSPVTATSGSGSDGGPPALERAAPAASAARALGMPPGLTSDYDSGDSEEDEDDPWGPPLLAENSDGSSHGAGARGGGQQPFTADQQAVMQALTSLLPAQQDAAGWAELAGAVRGRGAAGSGSRGGVQLLARLVAAAADRFPGEAEAAGITERPLGPPPTAATATPAAGSASGSWHQLYVAETPAAAQQQAAHLLRQQAQVLQLPQNLQGQARQQMQSSALRQELGEQQQHQQDAPAQVTFVVGSSSAAAELQRQLGSSIRVIAEEQLESEVPAVQQQQQQQQQHTGDAPGTSATGVAAGAAASAAAVASTPLSRPAPSAAAAAATAAGEPSAPLGGGGSAAVGAAALAALAASMRGQGRQGVQPSVAATEAALRLLARPGATAAQPLPPLVAAAVAAAAAPPPDQREE